MSKGETISVDKKRNPDEKNCDNNNIKTMIRSSKRKSWRRNATTTDTTNTNTSTKTTNNCEPSLVTYIPPYLRQIIFPYHGDFCQTTIYHPRLLTHLMAEGFLPIATLGALLPKLHLQRSVIPLSGVRGQNQHHVSKSVRKKSKKFEMTINQVFDQVVQKCCEQHSHCWLYPPLVEAFRAIHMKSDGMEARVQNFIGNKVEEVVCRVQLHSIEVWQAKGKIDLRNSHQDDNSVENLEDKVSSHTGHELVAGELGYSVGGCYTSLTGFSSVDSSGSVQLAALGCLLTACGFGLWDLGMDMEYKRKLGAEIYYRSKFIQAIHNLRTNEKASLRLPTVTCDDEKNKAFPKNLINARDLIDDATTVLAQATKSNSYQCIPFRHEMRNKNDGNLQENNLSETYPTLSSTTKKQKKSIQEAKADV
mmetsp:Transcript_7760/g.8878  ORF Transcript_7760/g.8878 Transcript_7760/m.8878 type:complete len:419 (+) Transcript_7760:54-1310(+)